MDRDRYRSMVARLLVVSLDPGPKSGWVVAIDGEEYYDEISLTEDDTAILQWFARHSHADLFIGELVHARPGYNITAQAEMVGSMYRIKMAASAYISRHMMVRPQVWQEHFDLIFHTDKKLSAYKRKKLKKATHLAKLNDLMWFDGVEMDVEKADSVLIALYGMDTLELEQKIEF